MRDRLWYASLILEAVVACMPWTWRNWPMFGLWLAFDVVTGGFNIWVHLTHPHNGAYQFPWGIKQPGVILTRILAGREAWNALSGPHWVKTAILFSGIVYAAASHHVPSTLLELCFMAVAVTTAAVGNALLQSVWSTKRLTTDPESINHGLMMGGYMLALAFVYLITPMYREAAGILTGIVATTGYSAWLTVFALKAFRG